MLSRRKALASREITLYGCVGRRFVGYPTRWKEAGRKLLAEPMPVKVEIPLGYFLGKVVKSVEKESRDLLKCNLSKAAELLRQLFIGLNAYAEVLNYPMVILPTSVVVERI